MQSIAAECRGGNLADGRLLGLDCVVDCLGDDLAVFDEIGIDPVSNPDLGVFVCPLEEGDPLVCSNVGVLECSMLRQLLGEPPGKLPYTLVTAKDATVDEDDNVFSDIAPERRLGDEVQYGRQGNMWGWLVVLAAGGVAGAVVRWYRKSGGIQGYSSEEQNKIERVRVQKLHSGGHSHGGSGG